jgi:hypothetical protein
MNNSDNPKIEKYTYVRTLDYEYDSITVFKMYTSAN